MRFFNSKRLPSSLASEDFENLAMSHQSQLRQEQRFQSGEDMRHYTGITVGMVGGMTGFGTIVAVGAGVLSAVALPVVLPVAAAVGVIGIGSLLVNKIATWRSRQKSESLKEDLADLRQEARHRGLSAEQVPSLPGLVSLGSRIDSMHAERAAQAPSVAPSTRRPGMV